MTEFQRLFGGSAELMDYTNVPTTVFTPLEYGCVGLNEEEAIKKHGKENIEVYHSTFTPLENSLRTWGTPETNNAFAKLICVKESKVSILFSVFISLFVPISFCAYYLGITRSFWLSLLLFQYS